MVVKWLYNQATWLSGVQPHGTTKLATCMVFQVVVTTKYCMVCHACNNHYLYYGLVLLLFAFIVVLLVS